MIPKTFNLINRKWKVSILDEAAYERLTGNEEKLRGSMGFTDNSKNIIVLNRDRHKDQAELIHTWWHEFFHTFNIALGTYEHNEAHIELCASIMHQFLQTAKGDLLE